MLHFIPILWSKVRTMKSSIALLLCAVVFCACNQAQPTPEPQVDTPHPEQKTIEEVVLSSYIDGLQNQGDSVKIDQGFHPSFEMIGRTAEGKIFKRPIGQWRDRQVERRAQGELPHKAGEEVRGEIGMVDITKDVAVTKLIYYKGDRHAYTDYITLYKMDGEWKIVSKVYTAID